jgi:uncharacterized protein (DUF1015 family)
MSEIKPFRGWRPRPELVRQVATPPYDVMNTAEAREMAAGNPISFLHVSRSEIDLPADADPYSPQVYELAAANFRKLIDDAVVQKDPTASFYVYEQAMGQHKQRGLVAGFSVDEYDQGRIKKHELTRKDKEDDRTRHVDTLNANSGPVFLTYRHRAEIDRLMDRICRAAAPTYDFVANDGIGHVLWIVSDHESVQALRDAFAQVDALYIADGHHRAASAWRVRNLRREKNPRHNGSEAYNHFLAVAFPDDQLQILGYYRAVKDLAGMDPPAFLARLRERFEVTAGVPAQPERLHEIKMLLDGTWHALTPRPGTFSDKDPVQRLDVSILQENLLAPVLGIANPRTDKRIDFIGGIRGTAELERRCRTDMKVAFALFPTSVSQLIAIADSGQIMPPKSTWFEPKLRDALVVRGLEDL